MNIKVNINGVNLWWLRDSDSSPAGPLAPLSHCTASGDIDAIGFLMAMSGREDSYAHVFHDGRIMRYRKQIGTVDDLQMGWL